MLMVSCEQVGNNGRRGKRHALLWPASAPLGKFDRPLLRHIFRWVVARAGRGARGRVATLFPGPILGGPGQQGINRPGIIISISRS